MATNDAMVVRQLPVFRTVRRAYYLLWQNRMLHVQSALPGLLLVMIGTAIPLHRFWDQDIEKVGKMLQDAPMIQVLPWVMAITCGTILTISFGAAWRRLLLLDQPIALFQMSTGFRRYLLLLVVTNVLVIMVLIFILMVASAIPPLTGPILILGMLAILAAVLRYSPLYTAALLDRTMGIREAATYMRGNLMRYTAIWGVTVFTVLFVRNVLFTILGVLHLTAQTLAGALLSGSLTGLTLVLTVSLTSAIAALSYDFLVHGSGPSEE